MRFSRSEFEKKYPNLAKEIEGEWDEELKEEEPSSKKHENKNDKFADYEPNVIDFLRRCETEVQGMEIIEYLRKRGEIDEKYAERLKSQLAENGIRSFGSKREKGYYESNRV